MTEQHAQTMFRVVFSLCAASVESLMNALCGRIDIAELNEVSNMSAASANTDGIYLDLSLMNK